MDIQNIIEVDKTFQVPFWLDLSWIDSRLRYKNLNNITGLNLISEEKKSQVWSPIVVFQNTNEKYKTVVDEETYIQIEKIGDYTLPPTTNTENAKFYKGEENKILMSRYYREIFICK